jgi:hypothetical protein
VPRALKPRNWLVEAVVLTVLVLVGLSAVSGWKSADAINVFPEALSTIPLVKPSPGYTVLTASSLRRSQPGQRIINVHVDYVPATTRSSGPFVVSVHPIDSSTWAGVALGSDGRCYGIVNYEPNPNYGQTYYARFPKNTPCRGEEADRTTVRSTEYPS